MSARFMLLALLFAGISQTLLSEDTDPFGRSDPILVVDGIVSRVYSRPEQPQTEYVVLLKVLRVEAIGVPRTQVRPHYPAPGECVYVHVQSSQEAQGPFARREDSLTIPNEDVRVRAYLVADDRGFWLGDRPGWFEPAAEAQSRTVPAGTGLPGSGSSGVGPGVTASRPPAMSPRSLGITAEPFRVGLRKVLKVTRVEQDSPAGRAGIEPGDVLVEADGTPLTDVDQLAAALRASGPTLNLTVRDVRSGRDVPVEVALGSPPGGSPKASATRVPTPKPTPGPMPGVRPDSGGLGAATELAFYDLEAAVKVTDVDPGSPADRAGLRRGMIVLEANGKKVLHPDALKQAVGDSGGTLQLTVVDPVTKRKGTLRVDLGAR
jgi:membrane-associated protease RseP (regulator of RpoE activity)